MKPEESSSVTLPALKGIMGDWIYYSCLMNYQELSARVRYADEVHDHAALSDMIQRELDSKRAVEVADYLRTQPQRFFNSIVVATYEGDPSWYALTDVRNTDEIPEIAELDQGTMESLGFLVLRGDEKIFALDGQHRLAGIKRVVEDDLGVRANDEVSVIFVSHQATQAGLERTRRLFTTLNKRAKAVSKNDIIALDEDDVMAICVRRLIERTTLFRGERIAFVAGNNVPVRNTTSLTTIGNLYDVLGILFAESTHDLKLRKTFLQKLRPNEKELEGYFEYALHFFERLRNHVEELDEFFSASDTRHVVERFRGSHGGSAMFRPIGLDVFTRVIARLTTDKSLSQSIRAVSRLPRSLNEPPFEGLMWNPINRVMVNAHKTTLREILSHMLGYNSPNYPEATLLDRYRKAIGDETLELPARLTVGG